MGEKRKAVVVVCEAGGKELKSKNLKLKKREFEGIDDLFYFLLLNFDFIKWVENYY